MHQKGIQNVINESMYRIFISGNDDAVYQSKAGLQERSMIKTNTE